ncbi:unnamed protein product [Thelazia callipaeda]|uniref:GST_C_6 domain-containing protein n=1 Tax=Thelazia callipaeda TaxID=103827 RepID=A0A0N5CY55_THECL|nr:unnamed protein product [Thelazia callipaeda]
MLVSFREQAQSYYKELTPWAKAAVLGGIAIAFYIPYRYFITRPRKTLIKGDYRNGMVYLYQLPRIKYIPSLSSFCLKLETWLRIADINYENICSWHTRSLEGSVPFLEYNGKEYSDSSLAIMTFSIYRDMTKIFAKEAMENHLSSEQRATSHAFEAMVENSLIMSVAYIQLMDHKNDIWRELPNDELKKLQNPSLMKHTREEILTMADNDLKAISSFLGSNYYFSGFKPTTVDATLFSVLAQIVYAPYELPQKVSIERNFPNLKEYCDRIKGRYWPDWEECTKKFTTNSQWKKKI